jgi:hypothetical protein
MARRLLHLDHKISDLSKYLTDRLEQRRLNAAQIVSG